MKNELSKVTHFGAAVIIIRVLSPFRICECIKGVRHPEITCHLTQTSSRQIVIGMDDKEKGYRQLTKEEEDVIVHKGTELPFKGIFNDNWKKGTYVCRRCGAKLYRSENKFEADCGWPSFDEEIQGAVTRTPDPDGLRTEISCSNCGAHLGHVFIGEGFTQKNVRHCVNSISMEFLPDSARVHGSLRESTSYKS